MYNVIAIFTNGEQEVIAMALDLDKAMAKVKAAEPWYCEYGATVKSVEA